MNIKQRVEAASGVNTDTIDMTVDELIEDLRGRADRDLAFRPWFTKWADTIEKLKECLLYLEKDRDQLLAARNELAQKLCDAMNGTLKVSAG
jgi:hypothetical protein